ncbi:phosphoadenosine phosphosulfate reductase [Enterobacter kobei]|uniref:phosphoadenosine phosphosulfate reductase n=1 Tax=Enterobacter kobei TaxID=208224 RepID=UPI003CEC4129
MSAIKIPLGKNVLDAANERIEWALENLPRICVSFSGGKDSTVMLHLTAQRARQLNRKFHVLFIDWEAQFSITIEHVESLRTLYADVIEEFYWVALPLTTQNSLSQFKPEWTCWEPGVKWVREPPEIAITEHTWFPFYTPDMTFEAFVQAFAEWFSQGKPAGVMVGIRTDESFNRFRAISSRTKLRFADDKPWTTATRKGHAWYLYPLYDWKTADIWTWFARSGLRYNALYDLMYQAGVPLRAMRICEPFGPEQRQGLWLYHVLEPGRWAAMCERVSGASGGGIYAGHENSFYGHRKLRKPEHLNWKSYAMLLLDSMPEVSAEHYRNKIAVYLHWYQKQGMSDIPDSQEGDTGAKDTPSWRRICKVLLNNDYWCRALSFSPNKASSYSRYREKMKTKRKEWGILCSEK